MPQLRGTGRLVQVAGIIGVIAMIDILPIGGIKAINEALRNKVFVYVLVRKQKNAQVKLVPVDYRLYHASLFPAESEGSLVEIYKAQIEAVMINKRMAMLVYNGRFTSTSLALHVPLDYLFTIGSLKTNQTIIAPSQIDVEEMMENAKGHYGEEFGAYG